MQSSVVLAPLMVVILQHPIVFISVPKVIFLIHLCTCLMSIYLFNGLFPAESVSRRKTVLCIFLTSLFLMFQDSNEWRARAQGWVSGHPISSSLGAHASLTSIAPQLHTTPRAREAARSVFLHFLHRPSLLPMLDRTSFSPGPCSQLQSHRKEGLGIRVT